MKHSLSKLPLLTVGLVLAACSQTSTPASSNSGVTASGSLPALRGAAEVSGRWFVELEGDPTTLSAQSVRSQQATFRSLAASRGIRFQEVASFTTLFNGFSVKATNADIGRISRLPGVAGVFPVRRIERPRVERSLTASLEPQMFSAVTMTGVDVAQNELGLTGQGVKVAVMDTGIDRDHPAFSGRIVAGYDFVGDAYGTDDNYTPVPDENYDDCGGHGTHVAGIVGGNDATTGFKGAAPGVTFGAYKVFGCEGSTYDDVMIAAMERALADGMNVLNMSIGSAFDWPQAPTSRAASRLVKRGMVVTVSAGNSGTSGQYATGAPSLGENVISTASVDNIKLELSNFTITPDGSRVGYLLATGSKDATSGASLPITKLSTSTPTTTNDGCSVNGVSPYAAGSLTGKAVLIRRGTCTFREKALNAQNAGAGAVILYNNAPGFISPTVAGSANDNVEIEIPVASVLRSDGEKIDGLIASGVTLTFNAETSVFDSPTGNAISDFSSYGMSPDLELKPDLSAPGGNIKSAYPLSVEPTGYAILSGTSMAAPHAAGIAALMLQAEPTIRAEDMRARLMNTASLRWYLNNGTLLEGVPNYVQRQGAGMVDVVEAYNNRVTAMPSKLSLGESETFGARSKVVVLKNRGTTAQVFEASHYPALTVSGTTLAPAPSQEVATMTINGQDADAGAVQVTVPAGGEVELNVVVTPPAGATDKSQYGGYVYLEGANGSHLEIPYSGFKGDYQSIQVLGNARIGITTYDFPALYENATGVIYPEGATLTELPTFTFQEIDGYLDNPVVLAQLSHQSRRLTFELLDASGAVKDTLLVQNYVARNATNAYTSADSDAFNFYEWDGKFSDGSAAPAGTYQLRVRVLKALGNESNPAHTETYTSQQFSVVR
ncbi:S8 family serine peptidase [Deinococcus sp. YIM 134068]|uniref:S8 family serine peptidase n=1 Tax=Deinococcus lichenicola TaxID=3118910 RepID=UPI002F92FD37